MVFSYLLLLLYLSSVPTSLIAQTSNASLVPVWPQPQNISTNNNTLLLSSTFQFLCTTNSVCPDPLPATFTRYLSLIFFAGTPSPVVHTPAAPYPLLTLLNITVTDGDIPLTYGIDESYQLTINSDGSIASLTAPNQWGILRGIETFAQLITWNFNFSTAENTYSLPYVPVTITDYPRWAYRAALIDTARHYLPVATIQTVIDALSYNKINILHWHAVDDESWPLYSATLPDLTQAAYCPYCIYTHSDIVTITQYAWERGIIIMLEIDSPAHATAFSIGYPSLVISCSLGQTLLNPVPSSTPDGFDIYKAMDSLLKEFLPLTGNSGIFMYGGDEVETLTCWNESTQVQQFMLEQGFTNVDQVRNYYELQLQNIATENNVVPMFWEEVFDKNYTIKANTIINVWLSFEEVLLATKSGQRVVNSYGMYLNQDVPPLGPKYAFQQTWEDFYLTDPTVNQTMTPEEEALLLGQSVSMWGIQTDANNIHPNMWPRASASAERFWSSRDLRDLTSAAVRIEAWRCKLVQRGILSGPTTSSFCPTPAFAMEGWKKLQEIEMYNGRGDRPSTEL